jgi:hypothetical protein
MVRAYRQKPYVTAVVLVPGTMIIRDWSGVPGV